MAETNDERIFKIKRNLSDAGMDEASIAECMKMLDEKRYASLDSFLKAYRKTLIDNVHIYTERIDCLDFFTYTLKKNGGI